ncbi:hypothetical protein F5X96DRAFT_42464 [Biscogniauxia mediterranea]|nr:hypothetical protein F5X96DRAFT_42464 [Biscogniauxia mediterranea]
MGFSSSFLFIFLLRSLPGSSPSIDPSSAAYRSRYPSRGERGKKNLLPEIQIHVLTLHIRRYARTVFLPLVLFSHYLLST